MATVIGGGPLNVTGEQGQSLGFASFFGLHSNTAATACSTPNDLGSADAAGNITHICKLSSVTRRVSIGGMMIYTTSTVTTNPKVYVYGLNPLTDSARQSLDAGIIPLVTAVACIRRLDANAGDPGTEIDHTLSKCLLQSRLYWTPIPSALDRIDTQGFEYLVVVIGTALVFDGSTAQIYGTCVA